MESDTPSCYNNININIYGKHRTADIMRIFLLKYNIGNDGKVEDLLLFAKYKYFPKELSSRIFSELNNCINLKILGFHV